MKSYQGWDSKHRQRMYAKLLYQKNNGTLPEWRHLDGPCEMCGEEHNTMPHAEKYGPTFEDYLKSIHILCGRCHAMLHLRFSFPKHWENHIKYVKLVKKGTIDRLPAVKGVWVIFNQSKKWDKEKYEYKEKKRGEWWEKLATDR